MKTRTNHLIQITLIYVVIALSGFLTWKYVPVANEIYAFLAADLVMTVVCFIFSVFKKNSSTYDPYWSVIPFYFILQWGFIYFPELTIFHYLTFLLITIWSWRLTLNWVRSWFGFSHEDWRYINLAKQTGSFYPIVNFLGIHLFPTLLVFVGLWPLFYLFTNTMQSAIFFSFGMAIGLLGTTLEFFADNQLARFRRRANPKTEDLLDTGIWGWCRNPNYLGEILFWIGLFLIGWSFGAPSYTVVGALVMLGLFVFISIPMKEKRLIEKRPAFDAYKKRVGMLFPKFS